MDASELLKCYAAGERDFFGVSLGGADLSGVDLSGVDLGKANLSGANLTEADLSEANLDGVNLNGANLNGAILNNTNLIRANLSRANLIKAELKFANLSRANLSKANLSEADLLETNLIRADLYQACLIQARLSRANLNRADLSRANLTDADLSNANLAEANLTDVKLNETKIDGTILAYQKISKELQQDNQELIELVKLLQAQLEKQSSKQGLIAVSNQGINAPHQWNGFYFRSKAEIKIAEALDSASVLFYPNSKARLNKDEVRVNKESDFLVFQAGKFGILEVDGKPYHQTAANDHERDRLFKRYGIRVIERFEATRCWTDPDKVVQDFLEILSQS